MRVGLVCVLYTLGNLGFWVGEGVVDVGEVMELAWGVGMGSWHEELMGNWLGHGSVVGRYYVSG